MLRLFATAAACGAFLFANSVAVNAAPASAPANVNVVPKVKPTPRQKCWLCSNFRSAKPSDPKSHQVVISLHASTTQAWVYDPETSGLTTLAPVPQENLNPIPGVGFTVKKNCCSPPSGRVLPTVMPVDDDGCATFPSGMEPGNYDIVITLPHVAINRKGTSATREIASKSVTIVLHVLVDTKGGHPRINNSVPPAVLQSGASSTQ